MFPISHHLFTLNKQIFLSYLELAREDNYMQPLF